jgi:hypothetical protein
MTNYRGLLSARNIVPEELARLSGSSGEARPKTSAKPPAKKHPPEKK